MKDTDSEAMMPRNEERRSQQTTRTSLPAINLDSIKVERTVNCDKFGVQELFVKGQTDKSSQQKLCCDCRVPSGQKPCDDIEDECPFEETEGTNYFFDKLPPLQFPPYNQCLKCGRRFPLEYFECHILQCHVKQTQDETAKPGPKPCPELKGPFIMPRLKLSCGSLDMNCRRSVDQDCCSATTFCPKYYYKPNSSTRHFC